MADEVLSESSQVEVQFDRLSIASEDSFNKSGPGNDICEPDEEYLEKWGFRLKDLYHLAIKFHKEKEGKAVHLTYENKLKLIALSQLVKQGPFISDSMPSVGVLDVIGRDRRLAWQALGDISRETAMANFIELLEKLCPLFTPYVEAHKRDLEEKMILAKQEEERRKEEEERKRLEEESRRREEEEKQRQEDHKRQIQEALNQQTYRQFKSYAEQQYPGNPEQQGVLIRQLQEQHYQQYMQQVYQKQLRQQQDIMENEQDMEQKQPLENGEDSAEGSDLDDGSREVSQELPPMSAASMWTRKDIKEFKESIRKEGGDAIIKVGHGETVTVRVPTHEDGTCLFWEFATDNHDIGFGVYFEWTKSATSQVSVHISESEEEEEEEDDEDGNPDDIERGNKQDPNQPPTSIIIPVYRRDCNEEVYAGSHVYPGQGVYLLKFDNSYSLWRAKTLYYRVYYTR